MSFEFASLSLFSLFLPSLFSTTDRILKMRLSSFPLCLLLRTHTHREGEGKRGRRAFSFWVFMFIFVCLCFLFRCRLRLLFYLYASFLSTCLFSRLSLVSLFCFACPLCVFPLSFPTFISFPAPWHGQVPPVSQLLSLSL